MAYLPSRPLGIARSVLLWHASDVRAFVFPALVLCGSAPGCLACVYLVSQSQVIHVGPTFRVKVDDHGGRAVRGLPLAVKSDTANRKAVTDEDGFAAFHDLSPGLYSLSAEQDVGGQTGKVLEVQSDGPGDVTVPMAWPTTTPVVVRSLKGILHVPNYVPGQPGPELPLGLLVGASGQKVAAVHTNSAGDFDFGITAPGIYFLNIGPFTLHRDGNPIGGRIAVSVEPDAPADQFELELAPTDCGLSYIDLTPCPPAELHIGQLRGRVIGPAGSVIVKGADAINHTPVDVDPAGPAVPDAEILVAGPGGSLVERLSTNRSGDFASEQPLDGSYDLLVRGLAFVPFRARIFVANDASSSEGLAIQLGDARGCGSARVQ